MRIGIDVRLWNETGVGRYIRNLTEELYKIDKNNNYVLFCLKEDAEKIEKNFANWKITVADFRWHSIEEQIYFPKYLYRENLDLMHFPYFSLPIRYNKPFVVTIHDLIIYNFSTGKASTLPWPFYYLKLFFYKKIISRAVLKSKKIIVPNESVKKDIISVFPATKNKIAITNEGFDAKIQEGNASLGKVRDKKYFLYVGNAYPHKNLDRLISAFEKFKSANKNNTELVLVGKNDFFYNLIEKKIKKEKLSDIHILCNVSDADLGGLYAHAEALVAPSLAEGFGLPPLEAMASKCLVLASDIPAFKEVCKNNVIYFDPLDIKSIVKAMEKAYTLDKKEKEQYIARGVIRSGEFSWKEMAAQTLLTYESSISL